MIEVVNPVAASTSRSESRFTVFCGTNISLEPSRFAWVESETALICTISPVKYPWGSWVNPITEFPVVNNLTPVWVETPTSIVFMGLPLILDTTAEAPVPSVPTLLKLILSPTLYPVPAEYMLTPSIPELSVLVTLNSCLYLSSDFWSKS